MSRFLLMPFAVLYGAAINLRNLFFDAGILTSKEYDVPILNVGNLATGGTGKTPHVEYLIRLLKDEFKVVILSRGYGRTTKGYLEVEVNSKADQSGDEPLQYKTKFPEITVVVCEKRKKGIDRIISTHNPDVIVLDDAFQHRYVKPSLNILLTEYSNPYFRDYLLPVGSLRETAAGTGRADILIITKSPYEISSSERSMFKFCIIPAKHQDIFFSNITYQSLVPIGQHLVPDPSIYKDYSVLMVCGIADPTLMLSHLKSQFNSVETLIFPDHHAFTPVDIQRMAEKFNNIASAKKIIITTEKDYVRLKHNDVSHLPIYFLPIEVQFNINDQHFNSYILNHVRKNKTNS